MAAFRFLRCFPGSAQGRSTAVMLSLLWLLPGSGWAQQPTIAQLKAAYIYNFVRYVEWPAHASHHNGADLVLCLAGPEDEALFVELAELDGKNIRNHRISVRRADLGDEVDQCAMIVIEKVDPAQTGLLLQQLAGLPTLTVSSKPDFLDLGGMIGLVTEAGKLRFDINLSAARSNNLVLTFQLLKLARKVRQP